MLTISLNRFDWERPAARKKGFAWEGKDDALRLVRIPGVAFETYQPHVGLYRDFASLPATPEAVLRFANRYGALHHYEYRFRDSVEKSCGRFTDWLEIMQRMSEFVCLADAVQAGRLDAMRDAFGPFCRRQEFGTDCERLIHERIHGKAPDVQGLTADELAKGAAAVLYHPLLDCFDWKPDASWNSAKRSVDARLRFWGLRDFMYGQLCISLFQGLRFQQCKACGKWSRLAPGVGRADKAMCSPSCRFTLYRQRRRRALELHEQGWSNKRIAKEIGSEIGRVKKWIAESKEEAS